VADLDSLPFPDKELFYREYKGLVDNPYKIITSRGCPYQCSYCYNSLMVKIYGSRYLRRRSVDNVIEELKMAQKKYGVKRVFLLDDVFTYDKEWLREFCVKYGQALKIPFYCDLHPLCVDEEMIGLLESAGCITVNLGIQTIDENLRKDLLCRFDTNRHIAKAIGLVKKSNIFLYVNIMLGLPGQSDQEIINTADFLNQARPDFAFPFWLRYYPRTAIIDLAKQKGELNDGDIEEIERSKGYSPFAIPGSTYNKIYAKLRNLLLLSPFLPRSIFKFVTKNKLYKYLPVSTFVLFNLNIKSVHLWKRITENKKGFISLWEQLQIYFYYAFKRFFIRSIS
jgi:radical SAM superfamily enzyme YgiQ (UPF0313 family)